jgi:hypothetical protein
MSASKENGSNSARYEMPRTPATFDELKATILDLVIKHFSQFKLRPEDVGGTTTTFKENAGKRVMTSMIVKLQRPIIIENKGKMIEVTYLRWHYKDQVGVSDTVARSSSAVSNISW